MFSGKYLVTASLILASSQAIAGQNCPALLDFELRKLGSSELVRLCEAYADKVILVVNTASQCAFTSQYKGLEALYQKHRDKGLVILGFPSNDFGGQEPGKEESIQNFCRVNYGVEFPMFTKIKVKGDEAHPFYKALTEAAGRAPKWNFHKYLIGRDGKLIDNYLSWTGPGSRGLQRDIEEAL
jgi:glutathione peroxidase